MVTVSGEARQGKYIKLWPSILKKARLRAVSSDKTLGQQLEEVIEEKLAREEREETPQKQKDLWATGLFEVIRQWFYTAAYIVKELKGQAK